VPEAALFEFLFGFLDVFHGEGDMGKRGIFFVAASHWRPSLRTHEMYLRCALTFSHIHPETWNTRNVGTVRIGVQTQHIGVEVPRFLDIFLRCANTNPVMMQLDNFY
jgi:hypothetical protein